MTKGKVAGFPRPLAEGELVFNFLYNVERSYGRKLESDTFRAEQEEEIEDVFESNLGRIASGMEIKLSPAGRAVGLRVATGVDEMPSSESRSNKPSVESVVDAVEKVKEQFDKIEGYAVPTGYTFGFAEPADEPLYTVKAN